MNYLVFALSMIFFMACDNGDVSVMEIKKSPIELKYDHFYEMSKTDPLRFVETCPYDVITYEFIEGLPLYAVFCKDSPPLYMFKLIKKHPQLINRKSTSGSTILHIYCSTTYLLSREESIKKLVEIGFSWEIKDNDGEDAKDYLKRSYNKSITFLENPLQFGNEATKSPPYTKKDLDESYQAILQSFKSNSQEQ